MPVAIKQFYPFLVVLLLGVTGLKAQQAPYLERTITLKANNQPLNEVFKSISSQTAVVFSYSQPFDDKRKIVLNCQKKPLRLVLNELLKPANCTYKVKDKYIIIKCDNKPIIPPSVLTGYVYNAADSSIISHASIYVKQTKHSAVSNDYGFFSLSYSNKLPNINVSFAKEDYKDTSLVIFNQNKQEILIYLYPRADKKDTIPVSLSKPVSDSVVLPKHDSILSAKKNFTNSLLEKSNRFNANLRNISDRLFSNFSVSVIPYIGTNHLLSVNTVNKYALNIIGGYSLGTEVMEIGGLFNIDRGNVKGVQIAGLFNLVGDSVKGAQVAGVLNITGKQMAGFQQAGFMNINIGGMKGMQIGGLLNLNTKKMSGVTFAGVGTISDTLAGAAIAGTFNWNQYSDKSMEMSCFVNHSTHGKNNCQLTGYVNSTQHGTTRFQIAAFVNRADTLTGLQLGIFNYANSVSGIPIGFLSIVKNGYHKLEVSSDELKFGTIAYCTGVPKFYNIFFIGRNYNKLNLWTIGYGAGSDHILKDRWKVCFNLTTQKIAASNSPRVNPNVLNKFYVGAGFRVSSKFSIDLGPTFNLYICNTHAKDYLPTFDQLSANYFYNHTTGATNLKMWVGAKISLKFF
jgi:hypothetical protein